MNLLTVEILAAGLIGILTLFIKTDLSVKILLVLTFIHCFFSQSPLASFIYYIGLVVACYLYIALRKIKNWDWVFNFVLAFLFFNLLMMTMQFFKKDVLLNFNVKTIGFYGVIGSRMQLESYLICTLALLISRPKWHWYLIGPLITFSVILLLGIYTDPILHNPFTSRFPVWIKTIQLTMKHPFIGWGAWSYKDLFMPLSGIKTIPWRMAHNDYLQVLFEFGFIGFALFVGYIWNLAKKLKQTVSCLIGLFIICADMMVHFPLHEIPTILTIIIFLAYCQSNPEEEGV